MTKNVPTDEEVGTNVKRDFIQLNGPSFGYKGIKKFLKAALVSIYDSADPSQFWISYKKWDETICITKSYKQN